jgi:hypothetical protein
VDTNIFLHHFEVLTQFVEDIERLSLPVIVIVPGAVIYELDGCVFDDYQIDVWLNAFHRKLVKKTAMAWHGLHVEPLLGF